MGTLLQVVGAVWAIIGVANFIMLPYGKAPEGILAIGILISVVLFILPGLIVYGIGTNNKNKTKNINIITDKKEEHTIVKEDIKTRLSKLDTLKEEGYISKTEYENRRSEILKET